MSRRLMNALALVVAVLAIACVRCTRAEDPPSRDPAAAERRVGALGRLEPAGTVLTIAAPSGSESSVVESLEVVEGEDVRRGQVLARFDTYARRQAALAEAAAQVASAEAELARVEAGAKPDELAAQRAQVALLARDIRHAALERERVKSLVERDAATTEELELKQWELDRAEIEHARAKSLLAALAEVRAVDVAVARASVEVSGAAVRRAEADLAASRVVAPVDGRVLRLRTRTGERVDAEGLLELGDVTAMHAVAEVYEGDLPRVRVGQRARVVLDSTREALAGVVVAVGHVVARKGVLSNDPVSDTDARVVEVRVKLDRADSARVERLANARVEVLIGDVESAPATPPGAR
ncbi:MAG: HlyD family efflux transporter periplasmic adaptor subunit [Lacipirellulaceae bacterium]